MSYLQLHPICLGCDSLTCSDETQDSAAKHSTMKLVQIWKRKNRRNVRQTRGPLVATKAWGFTRSKRSHYSTVEGWHGRYKCPWCFVAHSKVRVSLPRQQVTHQFYIKSGGCFVDLFFLSPPPLCHVIESGCVEERMSYPAVSCVSLWLDCWCSSP